MHRNRKRRPRSWTTKRTKEWIEARGGIWTMLEHWIPRTNIRRDGYGFLDMEAIFEDRTWGIQVCGGDGHAMEHWRKIAAHPNFPKVAKAKPVLIFAWRTVRRDGQDVDEPRILRCYPGDEAPRELPDFIP